MTINRLVRVVPAGQLQDTGLQGTYVVGVAVVIDVLEAGFNRIRHNNLPVPFRSFSVENNRGGQMVLRITGRESMLLGDVKVGYTIQYEGVYSHPRTDTQDGSYHGGYFKAAKCQVTSKVVDEYVLLQQAEKARLMAEEKEIDGVKDISDLGPAKE